MQDREAENLKKVSFWFQLIFSYCVVATYLMQFNIHMKLLTKQKKTDSTFSFFKT